MINKFSHSTVLGRGPSLVSLQCPRGGIPLGQVGGPPPLASRTFAWPGSRLFRLIATSTPGCFSSFLPCFGFVFEFPWRVGSPWPTIQPPLSHKVPLPSTTGGPVELDSSPTVPHRVSSPSCPKDYCFYSSPCSQRHLYA